MSCMKLSSQTKKEEAVDVIASISITNIRRPSHCVFRGTRTNIHHHPSLWGENQKLSPSKPNLVRITQGRDGRPRRLRSRRRRHTSLSSPPSSSTQNENIETLSRTAVTDLKTNGKTTQTASQWHQSSSEIRLSSNVINRHHPSASNKGNFHQNKSKNIHHTRQKPSPREK